MNSVFRVGAKSALRVFATANLVYSAVTVCSVPIVGAKLNIIFVSCIYRVVQKFAVIFGDIKVFLLTKTSL